MAIKFLSGQTITGNITLSGDITAATFNSLAINSTGTNNVANQIVRTEANGYANFGWINSVSGNHTGSITRITASNDAYLRYVTPAQFRTGVTDGYYASAGTVDGVTSVATGNGLTGGTITSTGTLSLDRPNSQLGAVLATYGTTAGASGRVRCTAPFNTNSSKMFSIEVTLYASYTQHNYVVSAYMYSTINQWYLPKAIYTTTGTATPDIIVGRDGNGKAYISIANGNYTGVLVHNMTRGYVTNLADTYDPWTITIDAGTENSVSVSTSQVWTSGNHTPGNYLPLAGGIMSGNIGRSAYNSGYQVGGYNNVGASHAQSNPIHVIGTNYTPGTTTLSNMYGIGYTRADASFMGVSSGSGWGMYVASDGNARVFLDGSTGKISTTGVISATSGSLILQDYNLTSTVGLNLKVDSGNVSAITIDNVGSTTFSGYTYFPNYLFHTGDTNTRIEFTTGTVTLRGDTAIVTEGGPVQVKGSAASIGTTQDDGDYLSKLYTLNADGFMSLYTGQGTPIEQVRISSYGPSYIVTGTLGGFGLGSTVTTGGFNVNWTFSGSYYNMSNTDSGNFKYTNPNGRLLTSNGAGWVADGRDPILTLSSAGNGGATTVGYSLGLNLYSNTSTDNTYSPLICFSNQSNSGSYATTYAAIGGKKTGQGVDANWSAGELHFWTAGPAGSGSAAYMQQASAMMIDDAGNVGIGTTSPGSKLEVVYGGGYNVGMKVRSTSGYAVMTLEAPANNYPILEFKEAGTQKWQVFNEPGDDSLNFYAFGAGAGNRMNISQSGNVGIGTTSPNYQLDVENSSHAVIRIHAGVNSSASLRLKNDAQDWDLNTQTNDTFAIYNQTSATQPFSILPNGNVGIGTTSPGAKFQVGATISTGGTGISVNAGAGGGNILSVGTTNHNWFPYINGQNYYSSDAHNFRSASHAVTYMVLNSTSLTASGDIVAYGSPSDKRLKENIKPIKSALDKVIELQGVTFDWKEKGITNLKEDIGFIAQDVQKVIPELVRENEDGMLSMRHQGIAPILLEAIKEQQKQIEDLQAQIKNISNTN